MTKSSILFLIMRVLIALILLQASFCQLIAVDASVVLFGKLSTVIRGDDGLEPLLRIGSGLVELLAVILLMRKKPSSIASGAFLSVAVSTVALAVLLVVIGVDFDGDVTLLTLTAVVWGLGLVVLFRFRGRLPVLGRFT